MNFAVDLFHRGVENFRVCYSHDLHVTEFAKGPAGIVIHALLRIARTPILIIEQRIGDAAVRLVHANDVAAGWEGALLCLGRSRRRSSRGCVVVSSSSTASGRSSSFHRDRKGCRRAMNFAGLSLKR